MPRADKSLVPADVEMAQNKRRLFGLTGSSGVQDAPCVEEDGERERSSSEDEDCEARAAYRKAKKQMNEVKGPRVGVGSCGCEAGQGGIKWCQPPVTQSLLLS